ncbi:alpha/beta hydrolase [Candidatus Roizmanbacteria bacterium]|nr:alpha/beta hydrolase [Candidatus Roizmanbacteria bacterium]
MKVMQLLLILVISVYLGICLYYYFFQERHIFFPSRELQDWSHEFNYEEISITTEDGETLHSWFLDNNAELTVLYLHGNGGNISGLTPQFKVFEQLNVNALVFDYRGYGKSTGKITQEQDVYSDAHAAYEFLLSEKKVSPQALVVWGHSLGGAAAVELTRSKLARAVILESTFTSLDELARGDYSYLPSSIILRYHFGNIEKIDQIHLPILIIHGDGDDVIPVLHAERLYEKANEPKTLAIISDVNNHEPLVYFPRYIPPLESFLNIIRGE